MIRIRRISLQTCDAAYLAPFVQQHGRLPVHQVPHLARILNEDARLVAYEFTADGKCIGFVIVKVRHRILADVSFGPIVLDNTEHYLACVAVLRGVLRRRGLLLLRVFPPCGAPKFEGLPANFNWATSIVDISRSEEDILKSFSPNHRQSIRKAGAANIAVHDLTANDVHTYADGHVAMFARRGIPRDPAGTKRLVSEIYTLAKGAGGEAFILSARQGNSGHIIGGGIFLCSGDTCTYYQGYAERLKQPLPVLHLVLWEAMKRARRLNCGRFDLSGYSLDGNDQQLKAVNDFKRWFRGEIIYYPPTVVIPLYPLLGPLLRLIGKRI